MSEDRPVTPLGDEDAMKNQRSEEGVAESIARAFLGDEQMATNGAAVRRERRRQTLNNVIGSVIAIVFGIAFIFLAAIACYAAWSAVS